jgi:hypothetical protein
MKQVNELPPKGKRNTYDWDEVAKELRANRGEWFEVAVMPYAGYTTYLGAGRVEAFREGRWEFTSRSERDKDGKRTFTIYGKFVGD